MMRPAAIRHSNTVSDYCKWKDMIGNMFVVFRHKNAIYSVGPHFPGVLVVIAMIVVGTSINLSILDSKNFSISINIAFKIFICFMATLSLIFLMLTATVDPGIILSDQTTVGYDKETGDSGIEIGATNSQQNQNNNTKTNADTYCDICDLYLESHLEARHCDDCNVCIQVFLPHFLNR